MQPTQIIVAISLVSITVVLVWCGIWMIKILKELRTTIQKTNLILDDTKQITSSVSEPISSISEFVMGFKNGLSLFNTLFPKKDKDKKEN